MLHYAEVFRLKVRYIYIKILHFLHFGHLYCINTLACQYTSSFSYGPTNKHVISGTHLTYDAQDNGYG